MRTSLVLFVLFASIRLSGQEINIIPKPLEVKEKPGSYTVKNKLTVSSNFPEQDWPALFSYLKTELKNHYGIIASAAPKGEKGDIDFFMRRMPTSGKPAYQLFVTKTGIEISSNFDVSAFHAIQTLMQLLPVERTKSRTIPLVEIFDHARFDYRGMHLDVCRHFWPVAFVKKYIDYLAYHKLNVFHWHLTDDQGWRIQVDQYPKLTSVGGWRNGTLIGRYPGKGNDEIPHGGFYTKEQIREVVNYARERFIDVIPEIEMPGHSSAAIAAYPYLSCFPEKPTAMPAGMMSKKSIEEQKNGRIKIVQETWGVFEDVFCAGNDSTFAFLQNVIDEVAPLFPSKYFHVGGDECPKTHWKKCPKCQARMKEHNLKDEHELQSYFIQRIEKHLNNKGKTLIGWDEILEGGLAPNAVVMSWQGEKGGIEAAKQKHYAIMTPGNPVYFDHTQSRNEDSITIGGYNPIENVYAYEPISKELSPEEGKYIVGAQANLWTEYIGNTRKVEYMLFPRLAALSEVLWSSKENRDWNDFEKRLPAQFKRYDNWRANYSKAYFDLKASVVPSTNNQEVMWKLETRQKDATIKYITHFAGRPYPQKFTEGTVYTEPVKVGTTMLVAAMSYQNGKPISNPVYENFHFSKATGKKISLLNAASEKYPGDGAFTLVNGVINEKGFGKSREFLGFLGTNCEAVIDLGESQLVSFVVVHALNSKGNWIWRPMSVEVLGSGDGEKWFPLKLGDDFTEKKGGMGKGKFVLPFKATYAKYIKVVINNWGVIPDGNPGAGTKAWMFVDEIEVDGPDPSELRSK